jgi:site-specific recombinase XerD
MRRSSMNLALRRGSRTPPAPGVREQGDLFSTTGSDFDAPRASVSTEMSTPSSIPPTTLPRRARSSPPPRRYLTAKEVNALVVAAETTLNPDRDRAMILLASGHGLRVSELVSLTWDDVDLNRATLHCRRLKGSNSGWHPLAEDQIEALRKLRERAPQSSRSAPVFVARHDGPMSRQAFWALLKRIAKHADVAISVHPHQLKHATGYALARKGYDVRLIQEFMGHRRIANTVRYTAVAAERFMAASRSISQELGNSGTGAPLHDH